MTDERIEEAFNEWTPNKALANIRGCKEEESRWVWGGNKGGNIMNKGRAFDIAHEMNLYL